MTKDVERRIKELKRKGYSETYIKSTMRTEGFDVNNVLFTSLLATNTFDSFSTPVGSLDTPSYDSSPSPPSYDSGGGGSESSFSSMDTSSSSGF